MNKTCLSAAHYAAGAKMIDFGGWEMPVIYTSIIEEHRQTRASVGVFDVSHMGRLELRGAAAEAVLQRACTRNVGKLAVGRCGYSHICNERGGILDDVIVSRYDDRWLVVCNASNRDKIVRHLQSLMAGAEAKLTDRTLDTCMIAVQGPRAWDTLKNLPIGIAADPAQIKRYAFVSGSTMGFAWALFRTGYTGEDGFEIVAPVSVATMIWNYLVGSQDRGGPSVRPAGLGARDTLRLEAGMPLYGHELSENVDPVSTGCAWVVDLNKDFVGALALRNIAAEGPRRKVIGMALDGRRIARQGARVLDAAGVPVGEVTSGTQSPTLNQSIAMAFVDAAKSVDGTALAVDFGGATADAKVVPLPFYKRPA